MQCAGASALSPASGSRYGAATRWTARRGTAKVAEEGPHRPHNAGLSRHRARLNRLPTLTYWTVLRTMLANLTHSLAVDPHTGVAKLAVMRAMGEIRCER